MATAALRELGTPLGLGTLSLKRIYKLDLHELRAALQSAGKRKILDKQVWTALLYRTATLRREMTPIDLALSVDAMAKVRQRDANFVGYILEEVRAKAHAFAPRDGALLLNALAKLGMRDSMLTRSLLPALLRRTTEKSRREDLALLALAFARLQDPCREPLSDRIVAVLMPKLDLLKDGHTLSLLACAFSQPRTLSSDHTDAPIRPLFAEHAEAEELFEDENGEVMNVVEDGEDPIAHLGFLEELLKQCSDQLWEFRSADVLHLCLALVSLERHGQSRIFPQNLFGRLAARLQQIYFEFKPAQFVRLLELLPHLPDLQTKCGKRIFDETAYCIRDINAASCLSVLRSANRLGGHLKAQTAVAWRMTRPDIPAALSVPQICEAAELLAGVLAASAGTNQATATAPHGEAIATTAWACREAMLVLLQNLQRRNEPDPSFVALLLRLYGQCGVRDTHWFHISGALGEAASALADAGGEAAADREAAVARQTAAAAAAAANPRRGGRNATQVAPPFSGALLADSILALARLDLPQLLESSKLFTHAAVVLKAPESAAVALEGAAILDLIGRRPDDMTTQRLEPLVEAVVGVRRGQKERERVGRRRVGNEEPTGVVPSPPWPIRLFPFTDAATETCSPEVLSSWQEAVASSSHAVSWPRSTDADPFGLAVEDELRSWPGIGLIGGIQVGPLRVPWAASFEGLAANVQRHPLDGGAGDDCGGGSSRGRWRQGGRRQRKAGLGRRNLGDGGHVRDGAWVEEARAVRKSESTKDEDEEAEEEDATRQRDQQPFASDKTGSIAPHGGDIASGDGGLFSDLTIGDVPAALASSKLMQAQAQPEELAGTHVLFDLLRDRDHYHASATLRGARQRERGDVLRAERNAEVHLLRRSGWHVCCLQERKWNFADGDGSGGANSEDAPAASQANRALVFGLIARLGEVQ